MHVSIVIPVYNEEENIPVLGSKLISTMNQVKENYEILFINDGSSDQSFEKLMELKKKYPHTIRVLSFPKNHGQSAAFQAGLTRARGEILVTLDADLQNDPSDIPKLLEKIKDYDMVCGIRQKRKDSIVRKVSSKIANRIRNRFTQENVTDVGCSLRAFRKELVKNLVFFNGFHRFFPTLVKMNQTEQNKIKIIEVPVSHHPRQHGKSKYGIKNRLFRSLYDLMGVQWLQSRKISYEVNEIK